MTLRADATAACAPRPTRRRAGVLLAFLLMGSTLTLARPAEAAVTRGFTPRFSTNTTGAITMTGNAVLTCPTSNTACLGARTGSGGTLNNNSFNMVYIDIDGNPATFNSSRNTLSVPNTATIAWAGLYWGADTSAGTGGTAAVTPINRGQVLFDTPDPGGYIPITAGQVDNSAWNGGFRYQGFADVTDLVISARSGEYTVANVQAGRGADKYGGWALVVAYQDPNEPVRNLTVFDGYAVVQQTPTTDANVTFPVTGFLTPTTGPVRTRVGVVAYEGDLGLLGDGMRLNSTQLSNSLNPATNFFNSSLTNFNSTNTTGDPFATNMLGFDIDTINANGILPNGSTSATITLNTNNDTYFPGVVSFSTELFAPKLVLAKSVVDLNGGQVDPGDVLQYTVRVTNDGTDGATNVVLRDVIPDDTTYDPFSLKIDGAPMTDPADADNGELAAGPTRIVARIPGTQAIGASHDVTFRVVVGASPVEAVINSATATYSAATSGLPQSGISNNAVIAVRPQSDLSVLKFGPTAPVTLPGTATYRIETVNRGPAAEPNAVVTDTFPAGFSPATAVPTQGSCAIAATIVCSLGALPVGVTATIEVVGSYASGTGQATNNAVAAGDNLDLFPNNNHANAVTVLNNPPTAPPQSATTATNQTVDITVLTGTADPDGDARTVIGVGTPTHGSAVVSVDGVVTYAPDPGYKGNDSFTYTITDGRGGFAAATVSITVDNASPVANPDGAATRAGRPVDVPVLTNDTDPNGDMLTITGTSTPANGSTQVNQNGTITYIPNPGFRGSDSFSYTITDGTGSATATVTIDVSNAAPLAAPDDRTLDPTTDAFLVIDVLANDIDGNDDPLFVVAGSATGAAHGTAVINATGTITYTPDAGFKGVDTFTYTITDGTDTSSATVTITVLNAPPTATDDMITTGPATPATIAVLGNDTDPNPGDVLSVVGIGTPTNGIAALRPDGTVAYTPDAAFKGIDTFTYTITDGTATSTATIGVTVLNAPPLASADRRTTDTNTIVTIPVLDNDIDPNGDPLSVAGTTAPSSGLVVVNVDGTVAYTPNAGFKGLDTFAYTITDGTATSTTTVTITVLNAPPRANADSLAMKFNTSKVVAVLDNDTDPNNDVLTVVTDSVTSPANGVATLNPDGTITYTPTTGFVGVDSFEYTITDGTATSTTTVTVTVTNSAPIAVDDTATVDPNTQTDVIVPVLDNDVDGDDDPIFVVAASATTPANGSALINVDGTITYTPDAGFKGVDTFTYSITDLAQQSTATVTVTVLNARPVATNNGGTTDPSTAINIDVIDDDSDPNPTDVLTIAGFSAPAGGSVALETDGTITYTPNTGFKGIDTFTYTITDGTDTSTATVTITVRNAPPVAEPDAATTASTTPIIVAVLDNDRDPNPNDTVSIDSIATPAHGTVVQNPDGTITYTPNAGFKGIDTFTYTITDGTAISTTTVTITVLDAPPLAVPDDASTPSETAVTIDVLANDSDPNGDPLSIVAGIVSAPAHGTVVVNPDGTVTYTPDKDFAGIDTFSYTITDGNATSTTTVTVTVRAAVVSPATSTPTSTTIPASPTSTPASSTPASSTPATTASSTPATSTPATSTPATSTPPASATTAVPTATIVTTVTTVQPPSVPTRQTIPKTGVGIGTTFAAALLLLGLGLGLVTFARRRTPGQSVSDTD